MSNLQYLTDEAGKQTSVLVPIEEWRRIVPFLQEIEAAYQIAREVRDGIAEVKAGDLPKQSVEDFLNEL